MKKIYLSILSIAIVGSVSAQVENSQMQKRTMDSSPSSSSVKPVVSNNNVAKAVLYTNDFSDASDWTFVDNSTAATGNNWVVGTAIPAGSYPIPGIASTTAANGFALFDSDGMCSAEQNADVYLTAPIDLTGNTAVAVEFETYYREYAGTCYVIASVDGVTWTEIQILDIGNNNSTTNPEVIAANVSAIVGGSATAYIGFRYKGACDYAWMVDDVSIVTLPANDNSLMTGWHADIINDFEYSMIPLAQAREMVAGVVVKNNGGVGQTFDVTCDVSDASGIVSTSVLSHTNLPGDIDTLWFSTGYTPTANGEYTTKFSIPADDNTADDEFDASPLNVNSNLMGHDYDGSTSTYGWNPATSEDNANAVHSWGNIFVPSANQDIYGVDISFGTGTTDGLYFLINVQQMTNGGSIQDPLTLVAQIDHTVTTAEIGTGGITIVFPSSATLLAGESYIIEVVKVDGTSSGEQFRIAGSGDLTEDDDYSTVGYGPYGTGSAVNYYSSWGWAPYIRANFDQSLSIGENTLEGVSIYPNPSEGVINITNNNNTSNDIIVLDVTGKIVYSNSVNASTTVDLSANGTGIYFVKVSNENGSIVDKVVIK